MDYMNAVEQAKVPHQWKAKPISEQRKDCAEALKIALRERLIHIDPGT